MSSAGGPSRTLSAGGGGNDGQGIVVDGDLDIAQQSSGERMMVQAPSRRPFQKVEPWTNKANNSPLAYNCAVDGPSVPGNGAVPRIPDNEELRHVGGLTSPFLKVGIVIGDNPARYANKGIRRDKAREDARRARGDLPRDPSALRVYMRVTEKMASQVCIF